MGGLETSLVITLLLASFALFLAGHDNWAALALALGTLTRPDVLIAGLLVFGAMGVRWLVERAPHRAATSFAHLLDAEGHYVAGWDGLTAPATCWHPGDVIYQAYRVALPQGTSADAYQVEVGWYDAETVQRWPCTIAGQAAGDRYVLDEVEAAE